MWYILWYYCVYINTSTLSIVIGFYINKLHDLPDCKVDKFVNYRTSSDLVSKVDMFVNWAFSNLSMAIPRRRGKKKNKKKRLPGIWKYHQHPRQNTHRSSCSAATSSPWYCWIISSLSWILNHWTSLNYSPEPNCWQCLKNLRENITIAVTGSHSTSALRRVQIGVHTSIRHLHHGPNVWLKLTLEHEIFPQAGTNFHSPTHFRLKHWVTDAFTQNTRLSRRTEHAKLKNQATIRSVYQEPTLSHYACHVRQNPLSLKRPHTSRAPVTWFWCLIHIYIQLCAYISFKA